MQHINEIAPRVSERRPDISPRLDAAVACALAKRPDDRFATMADFGRELEACLTEARVGEGASETMVLSRPRLRPARRRPRVPVSAIFVALGTAIAVAVLAVLVLRDHGSSPTAGAAGTPIALSGVGAYDPPPGDGHEHNADAPKATDGNAQTFWQTEDYHSSFAAIGKAGVGLVLAPEAGGTFTLHHVTVTTDTPGFTAVIEAGDSANGPFDAVSSAQTVSSETTFDLSNAKAAYFVV